MNNNDHTICGDSTEYMAETNTSEITMEDEVVTEKKDSGFAKKVAIGAGVGIMLGAGTAAAAKHIMDQNEIPESDVTVENDVNVAHDVNDNMSFQDAFEAARAEVGPGGVFHWHGNTYSTYSESEWNSMSDAERAEFGQRVESEVQNDENLHPEQQQTVETHTTVVEHHHHTVHHHDDDPIVVKPEDPDVELIGVQDQVMEDGSVVTVGAATVNGHNVVVVDVDHDSEFDIAYIDGNGNGHFEDNEVFDITDEHLTVSDFSHSGSHHDVAPGHHELANNDIQTGYEGDMPDYVNDADILA